MKTPEMEPDWTYVTIAEFEGDSGPLFLAPTRRMSVLIARAVGDAIPSIQCPDEAEEALAMIAFLRSNLGGMEGKNAA